MSGQMFVYSFTHHIVLINGREINNFAEGDDVITSEYREDGVTDTVGADGNMQASVSANESAEITLKFLAGAPENDYLEDLYYKFKRGLIGGITVAILNAVTGKAEVSTQGYIPKLASNSRGTQAQDREWMIVVPKLAIQKRTR